jgi:hypothetical protein
MTWLRRLFGRSDGAPPASPTQHAKVPRAFLEEVERALRTRTEVLTVRPLETGDGFELEAGHGEEAIYVQSLFAEISELSPDERASRLEFFIDAALGDEEISWAEARPQVLPVPRPDMFCAVLLPTKKLAPLPLQRTFLPQVSELVAIDRASSFSFISAHTLTKWGVSEAVVWERARENAKALGETELVVYLEEHGGIQTLPGEDIHAATRLLLPGCWAAWSGKVVGRPLVIVPDRSTLFLAGDGDNEAVRWMAETAQREWQAAPRAFSPVVYTADASGAVVPYRRPETEALGRLLRLGEAKLLANTYGEQKLLLDAIHERDRVDVFVATFRLVQRDDGCARSLCAWKEGVDTLLPCTDALIVEYQSHRKGDRSDVLVPFQQAREIFGDLWSSVAVPAGPERIQVPASIDGRRRRELEAASISLDEVA